MSTYNPTTSNSLAFDSSTAYLNQTGGTLVVGNIIYTSTGNSVGLADSDSGESSKLTQNQILLDQVLCREIDLKRVTGSDIQFDGAVRVRFINPRDPRNNPVNGLIDPPNGFDLSIIWRPRTSDTIGFQNQVKATGGMILDYSCNPPKLIPNIDEGSFTEMTEEEFNDLSEEDFNILGE